MNVHGLLTFIIIFLGIAAFLVFSIIFYNITTKSIDAKKSYLIFAVILILFVSNMGMALLNISRVADGVDNVLQDFFSQSNNLYQ